MLTPRTAGFQILIGAVLISFSAILVPLADVSAALAAFYRVIFGGALLFVIAWLRKERVHVTFKLLAYSIMAGLAFSVDLVLWHISIFRAGPAVATLLVNFQVFLMALLGWVLWHERLPRTVLVGIGLALVGLVLIVVTAHNPGPGFLSGVGFGLLAAIAYTTYLIALRSAGWQAAKQAPALYMGLVSFASAGCLGAWLALRNESFAVQHLGSWIWLILYGLGPQAAGWLLISTSLTSVPAATAGLLLLLQPVLTFEWDHLIFRRSFSVLELIGAALALGGLYLGMRRSRR